MNKKVTTKKTAITIKTYHIKQSALKKKHHYHKINIKKHRERIITEKLL